MLARFLNEAVPDEVTCLGVRLRPFSRGHYWHLRKWRSPFVCGGVQQLKDLMVGVLICSQDYDGARAIFADPDLDKDLARWESRIRGGVFRRLFRRETEPRLLQAFRIFDKYVDDGLKSPDVASQANTGQDFIASDWSMLSVAASMKTFGQSFDEAINQYMPLARWLLAINGEREGVLRIVDAEEIARMSEEARKIAEEVEEEGKSGNS